jgi:hypothetical protein
VHISVTVSVETFNRSQVCGIMGRLRHIATIMQHISRRCDILLRHNHRFVMKFPLTVLFDYWQRMETGNTLLNFDHLLVI